MWIQSLALFVRFLNVNDEGPRCSCFNLLAAIWTFTIDRFCFAHKHAMVQLIRSIAMQTAQIGLQKAPEILCAPARVGLVSALNERWPVFLSLAEAVANVFVSRSCGHGGPLVVGCWMVPWAHLK